MDERLWSDGTATGGEMMGRNAAADVAIVPRWHMPIILEALMVGDSDEQCTYDVDDDNEDRMLRCNFEFKCCHVVV